MAVKFREPHRCVATAPIFFDVIYQFEAVLAQHCLIFTGIKAGRVKAFTGQVAYGDSIFRLAGEHQSCTGCGVLRKG